MSRTSRIVTFLVVTVGVTVGVTATGTRAQKSDPASEVLALEELRREARVKNDHATIARLLADDFEEITRFGTTSTKANNLARLRSGELKIESIRLEGLKARVFGETVIVTGRSHTVERMGDQDISDSVVYTRVYVRRNGVWQAVAHQGTRIDPSKL